MALVGQPTTLCYDGFAGDSVPPFMDAGGLAFGHGYGYHTQLLEEECFLGNHPWELPSGVLGTEPGNNASASDGHVDVGWSTHTTGVSSSTLASSSVLTFDGQREEYCTGDAWMDATDQLSYSPTTTATATVTVPASFSFGGCGGTEPTASASQKRPYAHTQPQHAGAEQQITAPKKQCGGNRKEIPMSSPPRDPQSQVAKNRRERIGERLRALQELVPNGGKVDMVTMLDKAITYVKFMQLQLKVLETDAFWPEQGGKAPEISQVKAALDAMILSSSQQPRRWS